MVWIFYRKTSTTNSTRQRFAESFVGSNLLVVAHHLPLPLDFLILKTGEQPQFRGHSDVGKGTVLYDCVHRGIVRSRQS
jgi:hypothetical protein